MTALYPLLVDLSGARILVVGGGAVALRKVRGLLSAGGRPEVVAPRLEPELDELAAGAGLVVHRREYRAGDVAGFRLVVAATDRPAVNAAVAREAEEAGVWANVVDDPDASTFLVPAAIRQGEVTVALSTGASSPLLARRLRERLETVVTPGVGRAAERLKELREQVRSRWPDEEAQRRELWFRLVTPDFLDSAIAGRDEEVESRIERCLSQS